MTTTVFVYICIVLYLALALCVGFLIGAIQFKEYKDIIIIFVTMMLLIVGFFIALSNYYSSKPIKQCSVEKNYIYIQKDVSEFKIDTLINTKHINGIVSGHDTIYTIYYNKK